ncbi:UNKNOWN [Stylonychia lemnae]|uniref:Uncharacterized protein n=1 Tax=Stylonychia lemnae TaxID=5949 RepID=A0A078A401_STYLE|nr:UNKNOWN [Stylonychia lemnae]|eukprot:CDW76998.1 UNKNOWN [Stylonychia lemnae]
MKVVDRKSNITNSQYRRNLVEDKRQYQIDLTNFDLAYSLFSSDPIEVSFAWADDGASFNQDIKDFSIAKCPAGRFLGETVQTDNFGLQFNYYCPVTFNTTLQGNFATKKARFVQIFIGGCNQAILNKTKPNLKCANETDIKTVLDDLQVNILATNQFVDINERNTSPLSNQINQENITYYTIRADESQIGDYKKFQQALRFYILLDDDISTTTLEVYTISDALSSTGGILGIVSVILAILLSKVQKEQRDLIKNRMNLFKKAQKMLDKKLEIFTILRNIQMVKLLKRITLSNYQRKLTPYFRQNLVQMKDALNKKNFKVNSQNIPQQTDDKNFEWEKLDKNTRRQFKLYLKQVLLRKDDNKIDKRIFKNLDPELKKQKQAEVINPVRDSILKNLNKDLKKGVGKIKPNHQRDVTLTQLSLSVFSNYLTTEKNKDFKQNENWYDQSIKSDTLILSQNQNKNSDEGDYSINQYLEKEINY